MSGAAQNMTLHLLGHSGFLLRGATADLIFDYYTDEAAVLQRLPRQGRSAVFFASHAHADHYNPAIWQLIPGARHVLWAGIPAGGQADTIRLESGQSAQWPGIHVQAYGSTDQGISFLVEFEGLRIFHAGDLNDWYWADESTPEELAHDHDWFLHEAQALHGQHLDLACLPVDARLGAHALDGALHFARIANIARIAPMHLSGGTHLPAALAAALRTANSNTAVLDMIRPGQTIPIRKGCTHEL